MKYILFVILLVLARPLFAQRINGVVLDRATHLPVANAIVSMPRSHTFTSTTGIFGINLLNATDTLTIANLGYKTYRYVPGFRPATDTLRVYLDQLSIMLKDVKVMTMRDRRADSIRNRQQFASVYNYRSKTVMDAFKYRNFTAYKPDNYIDAPNNTTALVSVNVLSVISLLSKKKDKVTKLQKVMLKDEETGYVDRVFSRQKVAAITALKGDSLQTFMIKYRPSLTDAQKMTTYDVMMYIKKSYAEFKQ